MLSERGVELGRNGSDAVFRTRFAQADHVAWLHGSRRAQARVVEVCAVFAAEIGEQPRALLEPQLRVADRYDARCVTPDDDAPVGIATESQRPAGGFGHLLPAGVRQLEVRHESKLRLPWTRREVVAHRVAWTTWLTRSWGSRSCAPSPIVMCPAPHRSASWRRTRRTGASSSSGFRAHEPTFWSSIAA